MCNGRVARLLLEMSGGSGRPQGRSQESVRYDIAKMIGASREMVVSRVMKDLGLRGLIEETDSGVIPREKILRFVTGS